MEISAILIGSFERVRDVLHSTVEDLSHEQLAYRVEETANSIAWLAWHLTRVQDDHVADAFGTEQVWTGAGWDARFDLALDAHDIGYGHSTEQVDEVRASAELLLGYHDAVFAQTVSLLANVSAKDLEAVVDDSWDPPVTLAVRLVSVISDDLQHVGQAGFVRGLLPEVG